MRNITVICYDISSDKRRNKVARELLKVGVRTQYSVFECFITEKDRNNLIKELKKKILEKEDSVILYSLSEENYKNTIRSGKLKNVLSTEDLFV
ncbi:MAG TPA: CRISPR-associated endonuclease Cas2 [Hydrogenobaculum sp.]|nr:CRISPR-associated endonuclease Cas2 [Hydrogenobaculum sp.]